ncbi:hypothetical protein AGMMS49975_28980 [Clostridia bacterium]|nr:hypothetical protein AGMMS49975_11770 [Clostridia bacterium]GHU60192.1 hypothetical protein AGMMS49975_28980 [Clostridia bacterium]
MNWQCLTANVSQVNGNLVVICGTIVFVVGLFAVTDAAKGRSFSFQKVAKDGSVYTIESNYNNESSSTTA